MESAEKEQTVHMQYIIENWAELAILAWRGYLAEGRGCVVIEASSQEREGFLMVYYLSQATLASRGAWGLHPVSEPVSEYDPNLEIVVLFRLPGEHQPAYKFSLPDAPTPPDLYLQSQVGGETRQ